MRKQLLTLWIALAAIVAVTASSFGGSMTLLGVGKPAGGGGGGSLNSLPAKDSRLTLGRGRRCEGLIIEPERFADPSGLFGDCASGKNRTQNYCEQDDPATGRHDREDQAMSSSHYLSVQTTIGRGRRKGEPRRPLIARMADNGCGVGQAARLILG
jgi:hypothetical protein